MQKRTRDKVSKFAQLFFVEHLRYKLSLKNTLENKSFNIGAPGFAPLASHYLQA